MEKKKQQQLGHTSMEWVDNAATWNDSESPDWQTETYWTRRGCSNSQLAAEPDELISMLSSY